MVLLSQPGAEAALSAKAVHAEPANLPSAVPLEEDGGSLHRSASTVGRNSVSSGDCQLVVGPLAQNHASEREAAALVEFFVSLFTADWMEKIVMDEYLRHKHSHSDADLYGSIRNDRDLPMSRLESAQPRSGGDSLTTAPAVPSIRGSGVTTLSGAAQRRYVEQLIIPCDNCLKSTTAVRYAQHLDRCLGLGGRSRASRRQPPVAVSHSATPDRLSSEDDASDTASSCSSFVGGARGSAARRSVKGDAEDGSALDDAPLAPTAQRKPIMSFRATAIRRHALASGSEHFHRGRKSPASSSSTDEDSADTEESAVKPSAGPTAQAPTAPVPAPLAEGLVLGQMHGSVHASFGQTRPQIPRSSQRGAHFCYSDDDDESDRQKQDYAGGCGLEKRSGGEESSGRDSRSRNGDGADSGRLDLQLAAQRTSLPSSRLGSPPRPTSTQPDPRDSVLESAAPLATRQLSTKPRSRFRFLA